MPADDSPSAPHEDTREQIARLRAQVEALMRDRVEPALSSAAERAGQGMTAIRDQADNVTAGIRAQPLLSVLVAATVGFLLGRSFR